MCSQSKEREYSEAAQVHIGEGRTPRFGAPELNRESRTEEQRERAVRFLLDEPPHERADELVDPAGSVERA